MSSSPLDSVPHDPLIAEAEDPFALFTLWLDEATQSEVNDANAMSLATVDDQGRPTVRIVLLKGLDPHGFVFYTNTLSRKGRNLSAQPVAGLNFHWKSLKRQVRIDGSVETVTPEEADAYYASRPRGSRLGAWASTQSETLPQRGDLIARVQSVTDQYGPDERDGEVPRPPHWSGYRIIPRLIEFWQDGPFRLHDRLVYEREAATEAWTTRRLYP